MASTMTTFDGMLKEFFDERRVEQMCFSDRPFFGRIQKDPEFAGKYLDVPVRYGAPQGLSATSLAGAQAAETNVVAADFHLTPGDYFSVVSIGHKALMASRKNLGAYLDDKVAEIEDLYDSHSDVLAKYLVGNGGNCLGKVSAFTADTPSASYDRITLCDPADAAHFEVGMICDSSLTDGTSGAVEKTGGVVSMVDTENGYVYFPAVGNTGDWSADLEADDYLFREGDFGYTLTNHVFYGVGSWIAATSSPAALGSVTRTTHPQRLAGCRVPTADVAGMSIEERIQLLCSRMSGRYKAKGPWDVYLDPEDWNVLQLGLQARGVRDLDKATAEFGYQYVEVLAGGHRCKCFSDRFFRKGHFFSLRMANWKISSFGKLIQVMNSDGLEMLRKATTNDLEYRLVSYPVDSCNAPGYSGRCPTGTALW